MPIPSVMRTAALAHPRSPHSTWVVQTWGASAINPGYVGRPQDLVDVLLHLWRWYARRCDVMKPACSAWTTRTRSKLPKVGAYAMAPRNGSPQTISTFINFLAPIQGAVVSVWPFPNCERLFSRIVNDFSVSVPATSVALQNEGLRGYGNAPCIAGYVDGSVAGAEGWFFALCI
jgi:hypothetical protein